MKRSQLILSFCGAKLLRGLLRPLCLLPIRQNRVLFVSFRGKQYSCNPRAVSEELIRQARGQLEVVWAFHTPEKFLFLEKQGVRVLGDRGLRFLITALTARVVCTNTYYKPYLPRRKGQFYLRTWHGGGAYKRVDYPKGLKGAYIRMQQEGASLYLSSSKAFTALTLRGSFGYDGEVLEAGMPRNDRLCNGQWREEGRSVREQMGFADKKLALYAPTYRENGGEVPSPDAEKLRRALETRFGGSFVLLYRGHHVGGQTGFRADRDVSDYMDMQPLLSAADVLITDYSSSIWDMCLTGKPAFLYCPDLPTYERGFYTDIRALPLPVSENSDALCQNILSFDSEKYARDVAAHLQALGNAETGQAAKRAAERIIKECGAQFEER